MCWGTFIGYSHLGVLCGVSLFCSLKILLKHLCEKLKWVSLQTAFITSVNRVVELHAVVTRLSCMHYGSGVTLGWIQVFCPRSYLLTLWINLLSFNECEPTECYLLCLGFWGVIWTRLQPSDSQTCCCYGSTWLRWLLSFFSFFLSTLFLLMKTYQWTNLVYIYNVHFLNNEYQNYWIGCLLH